MSEPTASIWDLWTRIATDDDPVTTMGKYVSVEEITRTARDGKAQEEQIRSLRLRIRELQQVLGHRLTE